MDLADVDVRRMHPFMGNRRFVRDRSVETLGLLYEMHWPFRQKDTARGARRSPIHDALVNAGAVMGETNGWERQNWFANEGQEPKYEYTYGRQNWFENSAAEHKATREAVGFFDQTAFSKFLVQGPDAMSTLNRICAAEVDVEPGNTVYTQWLNPKGGIEADLTVSRWSEDEYFVVTPTGTQTRDHNWLVRNTPDDAVAITTDVTSGYAMFAVMGPNSRALLQPHTDADLSNEAFPFVTTQTIDIGYATVQAIRLTYVGELGWELYVPAEFAAHVYETIFSNGDAHGLRHAGYHAMNSLRMEKAYRHWGHDITDEDTPMEAGLNFAVAYDKAGGFIGRDALLAQKEAGIGKRLVQFKLDDPEPLQYHDEPIFRNGEMVGHTTSAMYGHTVGSSVSMGYVTTPVEMPREEVLEAKFTIRINGQLHTAQPSWRGFYDPANERTKM